MRFLANRDARLHFALLTDFPDAPAESLPGDASLLQLAETRIDELNAKYRDGNPLAPGERGGRQRKPRRRQGRRLLSVSSATALECDARIWMGYERKRGKLGDFNALLRGGHSGWLFSIVGATAVLVAGQIRHHARHGHAAAARRRARSSSARWRIR